MFYICYSNSTYGYTMPCIFCKPLACIFRYFMHIASILSTRVYRSAACTLIHKQTNNDCCIYTLFFHLQSFKAVLRSSLLMSIAELKILITFIYYAICLGCTLGLSSLGTVGRIFSTELEGYLSCEAPGGRICERTYERLETEVPVNLGLVVIAMYPVVNLIYVVEIAKIKKFISKQCNCGSMHQNSTL